MRSTRNQSSSLLRETSQPPAQEIRSLIEAAKIVLVVSHIDPDGDALGTTLAFGQYLKDIGKTVYMVRDSMIPDKYRFLPGAQDLPMAKTYFDAPRPDVAVILECPTLSRMGSASKLLGEQTTLINIDHHRDNGEFGRVNWIDVTSSSVGQMVYEYFEQVGYELSEATATNLYAALLTDTGRFRYGTTTARTFAIASELVRRGADVRDVCDKIYYSRQPSAMKLTGKVLSSLEYHLGGKICLLFLTKEMLATSKAHESESDGLVDFTLYTKGVVTGALLKEVDEERTKVSFRSANGVNVSEIAGRFGGGGHFNAAGCTIPMGMPEARAEVIKILTEAYHALGR